MLLEDLFKTRLKPLTFQIGVYISRNTFEKLRVRRGEAGTVMEMMLT